MKEDLEKYFKINDKAFYAPRKMRGINHKTDTIRRDDARDQSTLPPVSYSKIFEYVNEFIEMIRVESNYNTPITQCQTLLLDNKAQIILDNGIIAKDLNWEASVYDKDLKKYIHWDPKYDIIKNHFMLKYPKNIIWLKFTTQGHLGVVAKSFDINFDYNNTSGKLVELVGEEWDSSFVFIFPMTPEILFKRTLSDMELGIGQYLISKNVPIIDFYSHNN
jgi:hypothetical protein